MRKKISQREALRMRRELKRLREFTNRISGWASFDSALSGAVPVGSWLCGQMEGVSKGARGRAVFLVRRLNGTDVEIGFVHTPPTGAP